MGATQTKEEQVGATAPSIPEEEEGTPPTLIGGSRKTHRRKNKSRSRKHRKGKRHSRK